MIARRNIVYPECPGCGSERATRLSDALLPDDSYDAKESGVFRCEHCRREYQFLKPVVQEQVFSPTAQCPHCKGYKTRIISITPANRYHICIGKNCKKAFKTLRPENERVSRADS